MRIPSAGTNCIGVYILFIWAKKGSQRTIKTSGVQCPHVRHMQESVSRCLTPSLSSALSPRFTPDRERILFLSHSAAASSGAHNATATLCSLPWPCEPHLTLCQCCSALPHALSCPCKICMQSTCCISKLHLAAGTYSACQGTSEDDAAQISGLEQGFCP